MKKKSQSAQFASSLKENSKIKFRLINDLKLIFEKLSNETFKGLLVANQKKIYTLFIQEVKGFLPAQKPKRDCRIMSKH